MSIGNFIRTLAPSFKKKQILDDMDGYRKELHDVNQPMFTAAGDFFKNWRFKDAAVSDFDHTFNNAVKTKIRGNFVVVLAALTKQVDENIDTITVLMKSEFGDDIIKDGITYRKANLLQLSECVGLFLRYSRALLHWTYVSENAAITKETQEAISKGQLEWLDKNRNNFFLAANVLAQSKIEITDGLKKITDAVYSEGHDDVVSSTVGKAKIDPFNFFVVGTNFNIFYHVRMRIADWQVDRYKAAKEEQRALSYRLLNLKEVADGSKGDVKLQLELGEVEGRLKRLNASLAKKEEEYGQ